MTMMTRIKTKQSTTTMMAMNDDEEADNDEAEIFQNVSLSIYGCFMDCVGSMGLLAW